MALLVRKTKMNGALVRKRRSGEPFGRKKDKQVKIK
jgi:hypothetical protein